MIEKAKEKVCYLINFLSIALYFFLVSILEAHFEIAVFRYLGWILLAFGLLLIISSTLALIRKNIKKLIEDGIYGFIRHPMYLEKNTSATCKPFPGLIFLEEFINACGVVIIRGNDASTWSEIERTFAGADYGR
jgi:hypothetical protein